jgi:hypothetical protein
MLAKEQITAEAAEENHRNVGCGFHTSCHLFSSFQFLNLSAEVCALCG